MVSVTMVIAENNVNYMASEFGFISDILESFLFGVKFKMDSSKTKEMLKNASDPKNVEDVVKSANLSKENIETGNNKRKRRLNKFNELTKFQTTVSSVRAAPFQMIRNMTRNTRNKNVNKHQRKRNIKKSSRKKEHVRVVNFPHYQSNKYKKKNKSNSSKAMIATATKTMTTTTSPTNKINMQKTVHKKNPFMKKETSETISEKKESTTVITTTTSTTTTIAPITTATTTTTTTTPTPTTTTAPTTTATPITTTTTTTTCTTTTTTTTNPTTINNTTPPTTPTTIAPITTAPISEKKESKLAKVKRLFEIARKFKTNKKKTLNMQPNVKESASKPNRLNKTQNRISPKIDVTTENNGRSKALSNLYKIAGEGWGINNTKHETNFICPDEEGHFPSTTDCTVYYICVHGVGVRYQCVSGLMWNSDTGLCDWAHSVQC